MLPSNMRAALNRRFIHPRRATPRTGTVESARSEQCLATARQQFRRKAVQRPFKVFAMNENTHSQLERQVVELGDAKEATMGIPAHERQEENPVAPFSFDT